MVEPFPLRLQERALGRDGEDGLVSMNSKCGKFSMKVFYSFLCLDE